LILDQSSSLVTGQPNYDNWNIHMLGFAASLVRSFPVSPRFTHIGLVKFSNDVDIVFHLYNYTEPNIIFEVLQGLDIDGGDTNIAGGLGFTIRDLFLSGATFIVIEKGCLISRRCRPYLIRSVNEVN